MAAPATRLFNPFTATQIMNLCAVVSKRVSPSCAPRVLGEKKRCPVKRQLHLAAALVEEETESPAPATFYPHKRSHRQVTEMEGPGIGARFGDFSNGSAPKSLDVSSETTVSPLIGVSKKFDVVLSPRHTVPHHRSKAQPREPPAAFRRFDTEKEKACLPQSVLLDGNPTYHSSTQSNHSSVSMGILNTSSESARPLGRVAPISLADDPVFDSDRELHNHRLNRQSNQPHYLMKSPGTSSKNIYPVNGQAVLKGQIKDHPSSVLPLKPRQPHNPCEPRSRLIEVQNHNSVLNSSSERRNPSSKPQSNESQFDRSYDFMKSSDTFSTKTESFGPVILENRNKDHPVTTSRCEPRGPSLKRIEEESRNFKIRKTRWFDVRLSKSQLNKPRKSLNNSALNNLEPVSKNTPSLIRYRMIGDRVENHSQPTIETHVAQAGIEGDLLSVSTHNESRKSLNNSALDNLESVAENTPSLIRYHIARDEVESHSQPMIETHVAQVGIEGDLLSVSTHESCILSSKLQFNESHNPRDSSDESSESTRSLVRHYITKGRLVRRHHSSNNLNAFDVGKKSGVQYFKSQRVGGMGGVHGEDVLRDDSAIHKFRQNTYRDMEADPRSHRGKRYDKKALADYMFASSPEEMEYAQAREAVQRGSSITFKPEQPTMGSLSRMAPTLEVANGSGRYDILEQSETAKTPQSQLPDTQRLAVDGSHTNNTLGHAIRLAMRNGTFRPADQENFLRVVQNLLSVAAQEQSPSLPPKKEEKKKKEEKEEKEKKEEETKKEEKEKKEKE